MAIDVWSSSAFSVFNTDSFCSTGISTKFVYLNDDIFPF